MLQDVRMMTFPLLTVEESPGQRSEMRLRLRLPLAEQRLLQG